MQEVIKKNPDGMTLEQVGEVIGVTRERVRQIEVVALHKVKTGEGAGDFIECEGQVFAIVFCDTCGEPFPRKGRKRECPDCDEGLTVITVEPSLETYSQSREITARNALSLQTISGYAEKKERLEGQLEPLSTMGEIMRDFFSIFEISSSSGD